MDRTRPRYRRRFKCPKCGDAGAVLTGICWPRKATNNPITYRARCPACGHNWRTIAKAAAPLYRRLAKTLGQDELAGTEGC